MNRAMVVSLIGRPNVGKSSVFNRILRKGNVAMTHDLPGVTRDRHYAIATIDALANEPSQDVIIVDTGGFYPEKVEIDEQLKRKNNYEPFFNIMADHAKLAIDESDLVLFVVDVREGLLPFDKMICDYLRVNKKPFWLLINKFDSDAQWGQEADFYSLGIEEENFMIISAEHARGMEVLRERLQLEAIAFTNQENDEKEVQKGVTPNNDVVANIALIGAPNVGKSTLLNRLVGAERSLVSDIAGTTVDPIYGYFDLNFDEEVGDLISHKDQFRRDDFSFMEQYKQYLVEMADKPQDSSFYNIDEDDDYQDEEDDLLMLEKFDGEEDDLVSEEEQYTAVFDLSDDSQSYEYVDGDEELEPMGLDDYVEDEEMELSTDDVEEEVEEIEKLHPWRSIKIVDTAGIRRSKQVKGHLETQSVYRSLRSITESDVVIYMVDATKGILHQDRRLIDISLEKGKSVIVCLNKMDLMREKLKTDKDKREWLADLRAQVPWLSYCELITISAKKGSHIKRLKASLKKTILIRHNKISTSRLNQCVNELVDRHPIMVQNTGTRLKIKYAAMVKCSPPTFLLFSNRSKGIPENFRRYLTNGIRNNFQLVNTPVHLIFRTRGEIERRMRKVSK